jgi:hypothetical protein
MAVEGNLLQLLLNALLSTFIAVKTITSKQQLTNQLETMKINPHRILTWVVAAVALPLALNRAAAQTTVLIHAFDNSDEVTVNNGQPWQNWFGTAFYQVLWDASDASNNVNSGSIKIEAFFPDSGIGGCCGPQFLAMNAYDGINPPLPGNGSALSVAVATNLSFDVRFEADSVYNTNANNWPTIEVGTRGTGFGQPVFGTFTIPHAETGWVRVNIPIAANPDWATIPNIFFKHYSPTLDGWLRMYVDNIEFTTADVAIDPPTLAIEPARPGLRLFTGPGQYNRTQLASQDTNQSWVGGTYPVTYSFTISKYLTDPPLNQFHVFLIPVNYIQGGGIDQYTDYSSASNNFQMAIVGGAPGTPTVTATLSYKTNAINASPNQTVLTVTNETANGTWAITFNSATTGTLTAPGASPAAFSLPADVAATFANPLVAFFGVQPNPLNALAQHVEVTHIQTANVAAPGVPINSDFTTGAAIDTNIWRTASVSADASNLVIVDASKAWWVNWGFPDSGFSLTTKANLDAPAVPWKTPHYFTGYDTNNPVLKKTVDNRVTALIPVGALPTTSGLSNGVPAGAAFFRMQKPAPAE